jgi:hypothetical protein
MKAIPLDYDENPERFRANVKAVDRYALESDVHETVAERLAVTTRSKLEKWDAWNVSEDQALRASI